MAEPIKRRTGTEILHAYNKMNKYITQRGFRPSTHWLDHEAAQSMKYFDVAFAPDKSGKHRSTNAPIKPQCVQDNHKIRTHSIFTRGRIQSGNSDMDQGNNVGSD